MSNLASGAVPNSTTDYTRLSAVAMTASPPLLSYNGAREALLNVPTTLQGNYDPQKIAKVELLAENKFPLGVSLNPGQRLWQVRLDKGFQSGGARWLKLRGLNAAGQEVISQIVYITVTNNPQNLGQLTVRVLQDTLFKAKPVDSTRLPEGQKVLVKAGQTFPVLRYGLVDGHLKLDLDGAIAPVGSFGYFFEEFVQLRKGSQILRFDVEDVPGTSLMATALVTTPTVIKAKPVDSSTLPSSQKIDLIQGQTLQITGFACTRGHFRITLKDALPGLGNTGFVYWQHLQIKRGDDVVPYDPAALMMTATQTTILKKRPVDSAQLQAAERHTIPKGNYFGVSSYGLESGHIKVALTEDLPKFGNTGFVYPAYVRMQRGSRVFNPFPPQLELNIPYFSQRDNPRSPQSTCNVTSIAMALYYYGVRSKRGGQLEDELLQWCLNKGGPGCQTDNNMLSQLIAAYGFKTSFSTTRKWVDVKTELASRRPVVLGGDFTASGHIVCLIGYTPQGYIVNDPWGDALTGYTDTEGRKLLYPYAYLDRVAGPDGRVWAHFIAR
jgi:hypothetical protein